jgi:hypothetical protein
MVTGLWDIGRGDLSENWSRPYSHYLEKFNQLLDVEHNLIIFGDEELRDFVFKKRTEENTQFIHRKKEWFKNEFYDAIQKIRTDPRWYNLSGWLKDSTQSKLEYYNPLVMSKVFLLHDAKIMDKFNSSHLFWVDAGITNTLSIGYLEKKILDKLLNIDKISFISFPYKAENEIHGFEYKKLCEISNAKVNKVCRGGFFGGNKDEIGQFNSDYYHLLGSTLKDGYMGTEESIFTIMIYLHSDRYNYFEIEENGLIYKFFDDLKNDKHKLMSENKLIKKPVLNSDKVGLYVITFNSPKQFEALLKSMSEYDSDFIEKPKKFLLDNSTDLSTTPKYKSLCEEYGFEHIKKDNLGIVGGRIFVAEHFNQQDLDFYFWFEDDMIFYNGSDTTCRNGFVRKLPNLYKKSLQIIRKENFDFLKLNFTEFYSDNSYQVSWYNVPQKYREERWPNYSKLPQHGLDPSSPRTEFKNIKSFNGVPYASGEIYICNWPIILTKQGNIKCYLETKWDRPYEQTLMSHCYQETMKGRINGGLLLATPTQHNRFEHYDGKLRREN